MTSENQSNTSLTDVASESRAATDDVCPLDQEEDLIEDIGLDEVDSAPQRKSLSFTFLQQAEPEIHLLPNVKTHRRVYSNVMNQQEFIETTHHDAVPTREQLSLRYLPKNERKSEPLKNIPQSPTFYLPSPSEAFPKLGERPPLNVENDTVSLVNTEDCSPEEGLDIIDISEIVCTHDENGEQNINKGTGREIEVETKTQSAFDKPTLDDHKTWDICPERCMKEDENSFDGVGIKTDDLSMSHEESKKGEIKKEIRSNEKEDESGSFDVMDTKQNRSDKYGKGDRLENNNSNNETVNGDANGYSNEPCQVNEIIAAETTRLLRSSQGPLDRPILIAVPTRTPQSTKQNGSSVEKENENPSTANNKDDLPSADQNASCFQTLKARGKPLAEIAFPIFSILVFLADIVTDCLLARRYYKDSRIDLFCATLVLIIAPAIFMSIVDLSWVFLDRREKKKKLKQTSHNLYDDAELQNHPDHDYIEKWTYEGWQLFGRVVVGIVSFGRIYRTCVHVYHVAKSHKSGKHKAYHTFRAVEEKRDYSMLDLINAFTESAPQLMVQLFLFFNFELDLDPERVFSLLSSWLSIAWSYACYYKGNRDAISGKNQLTYGGLAMFGVSLVFCLASRVVAIALFINFFKYWAALVIGCHLVLMMVWIFFVQNPRLEGLSQNKLGRRLYQLFFSYISVFCFVNLTEDKKDENSAGHLAVDKNNEASTFQKDTSEDDLSKTTHTQCSKLNNCRTQWRMSLYYLLFYLENFIMSGLVLWRAVVGSETTFREYFLMAVPLGFLLHIVTNYLYYRCLHPTVGKYTQLEKVIIVKPHVAGSELMTMQTLS